jgi:hypothetical protein
LLDPAAGLEALAHVGTSPPTETYCARSTARTSIAALESRSGFSSQTQRSASPTRDGSKVPLEVGTAEVDYVDAQLVRLMDIRVPKAPAGKNSTSSPSRAPQPWSKQVGVFIFIFILFCPF